MKINSVQRLAYRQYVATNGRRVAKLQAAMVEWQRQRHRGTLVDALIGYWWLPAVLGPKDYCSRCGKLIFSGTLREKHTCQNRGAAVERVGPEDFCAKCGDLLLVAYACNENTDEAPDDMPEHECPKPFDKGNTQQEIAAMFDKYATTDAASQ